MAIGSPGKAATRGRKRRLAGPLLLSILALHASLLITVAPAWSLSELKPNETAPPSDDKVQSEPLPAPNAVPMPDPVQPTPPADDEAEPDDTAPDNASPDESEPEDSQPDEQTSPDEGTLGRPEVDPDAPPPEVIYDLDKLPEPVKRMRQLIVDAAASGNIKSLRPLIGKGDSATQLALGGIEGDPVQFLRELSGDKEGQEILAILEEVLSAGYVHLDVGKPTELYVWPYFYAIPLDKLTARQRVELFKIITAGDYEDMKSYGAYIFYRVGITPDGKWSFFVAGD